jgi:hypothetical protein
VEEDVMIPWCRCVVAAAVLAVMGAAPVRAQGDTPMSRATLKGLPGVEVIVETLADDLEKDGVREADIRSDVLAALQAAGVRVLTEAQSHDTGAAPFLYVSVSSQKRDDSGLVAYEAHIEVHQVVTLASGAKAFAMTWGSTGEVGSAYASSIQQIRARVKAEMAQFVEAWSSVNPRRR